MKIDILLFAKAPIAGLVKTRLIPSIGAKRAASVYQTLLENTVKQAQLVDDCRLVCWVLPDKYHAYFQGLDVLCESQPDGDLGMKMLSAAKVSYQQGRSVILIGGDCPVMSHAYIQLAVEQLKLGKNAVMGRSDDGGYVLLALREPHASLFENMPWSTSLVANITCQRMSALGWDWSELPVLWDLDDGDDWLRYQSLE